MNGYGWHNIDRPLHEDNMVLYFATKNSKKKKLAGKVTKERKERRKKQTNKQRKLEREQLRTKERRKKLRKKRT